MQRTLVKDALAAAAACDALLLQGWVRTRRDAKTFSFIELNDGSCLKGIQVIADSSLPDYAHIEKLATGAAISVRGRLVPSQGQGQKWEVVAESITVVGEADATYPLQKKGHSLEFLREIAHLRPRSNLFGAVFRVRSRLAYAIHRFFQERSFVYVHTPIITASDAEGAGDMFRVTTLDLEAPPKDADGRVDATQDFFGKKTFLTVSGQLEAEIFACALSNVYTFGPTFRAENSNTSRHAAEFWMIEPEVAFCDLDGDMTLAEEFVKYLIRDVREHCAADLEFFGKFVDKELLPRLDFVLEKPFVRCSYTEAVELLEKSGRTWEHPVAWGANLQAEHERFLTEEHFKCPVTVYNYPRAIKAFYMRANDDCAPGRETVAAMDLLVPGIGEIIGGSQREERLEKLRAGMALHHLDEKSYAWYLDLRRYGTVPHAGFGLGFERMLMFVTGVGNIRDVIPFARTPGTAEF
ncbi:asparagine--tRNA ligase [Horticoccus luteus]|uniref:Asparagine--tRNA ligase n=1 Tax=Horticoccus luteus TaxID=2862869 RepID=A0A8F9TVQ0_9BACT|nr:asparagine--tRNA ligase [Horticoccus luteus]QYM79168.1 asparagine--tRNA ligase [Horticoccus luteus]